MSRKDIVLDVAAEFDVHPTSLWASGNTVCFEIDGMPVLTFFVELAERLSVPLENISVTGRSDAGFCPTCGPGSPTFDIEIDMKPPTPRDEP